jgi:hypothetical protein
MSRRTFSDDETPEADESGVAHADDLDVGAIFSTAAESRVPFG